MDKITASPKIMSEVSPLDEFFVILRANFLNKTCLHRMKSGIFGTKTTVQIPVISCPSKKAMQGFTVRWYPARKKYK